MSNKNIAYDVILSPVVTEKSTNLNVLNKLTFKVSKNATKFAIKKSIEKLYKVEVIKINRVLISKLSKLPFLIICKEEWSIKFSLLIIKSGNTKNDIIESIDNIKKEIDKELSESATRIYELKLHLKDDDR